MSHLARMRTYFTFNRLEPRIHLVMANDYIVGACLATRIEGLQIESLVLIAQYLTLKKSKN